MNSGFHMGPSVSTKCWILSCNNSDTKLQENVPF
jgi:hypothetical protein